MKSFALARLLQLPLILAIVYALTAALLVLKPGDILEGGERAASAEARAARAERFHLDQHPVRRFGVTYPMQLVVHRDLPSMEYNDWTVSEIIAMSFPVSLQLGVFALVLAVLGGTVIGTLGAVRRGTLLDHATLLLALIGVSLPAFVVAELVLILFTAVWPVLPVGGWGRPAQLILPGVVLALPFMAYVARLMRAELLDVMQQDFIRTARAKGCRESRVVLVHAFPVAFLPVLSFLGPAAAGVFTGSFVVEKVFRIPGLGTHFVNSVKNGDQTLALGIVVLYASLLVVFNLAVDLLYALVDPRIRVQRA